MFNWLGDIPWKYKLLVVCCIPVLTGIFVVGIIGVVIERQSDAMEAAMETSTKRSSAVKHVAQSINEMENILSLLIAVDDGLELRQYAIHSIKQTAVLDEALHALKEVIEESNTVAQIRKKPLIESPVL